MMWRVLRTILTKEVKYKLHVVKTMSTTQLLGEMNQLVPSLSVTPSSALVDTQVTVEVTGITPSSPITIRSVCEEETKRGPSRVEAFAHYITNSMGMVSVPEQESLGGTYTGKEPSGLFWSMKPMIGQPFGVRLIHKDMTTPMVVNLSLYRGHLDVDALQTAEPEATATAERWYMGENVERIVVHVGRLRGVLFKPKGPGPFPGVIDMFGTAGGLIEIRAAMLASHGFASYALPFFHYEDLPPVLWELELEYFKEAVDWLDSRPFVRQGGIGMVGVSSGAVIILATVAEYPDKIKAAILINGSHAQALFPMKLNGKVLPYVPFDNDSLTEEPSGALNYFNSWSGLKDLHDQDERIIRTENAPNCQFLFIVGEDDKLWDCPYYANQAIQRLKRYKLSNYQLLSYPGAGHLLEVPHAPISSVVYSPSSASVVDHGGSIYGNAKAMEDMWPKMLSFLHRYCGQDKSKL